MNKNIFIIDTYPKTETQKKLLIECIHRLRMSNFDIMIVSHLPIPEDIQKLVDHYLYDSDNTFLPKERTAFNWVNMGHLYVEIYNSGHLLAISRNMNLSLNFCKSLGYEFFYFMEYDILFSENDLNKLIDLKNKMISLNKKSILFEPKDFRECGSPVYETLLFGGLVEPFLSLFTPPKNLSEWDKINMGYTFELSFYEQLSKNSEELLVINNFSYEIFTESQVNIYRYGGLISDLIYNESEPEKAILFIYRYDWYDQDCEIIITKNGEIIFDETPSRGYWSYLDFNYDNSTIKIEIKLNGEIEQIKEIELDYQNIESIKSRGKIIFK